MKKIIELEAGHGTLLIQSTDESEADLVSGTGILDDVIEKVSDTLSSRFRVITNLANSFVETLDQSGRAFDSAEFEFGLSLTGKGTIYVVQTEAEATFKVKLTYKSRP